MKKIIFFILSFFWTCLLADAQPVSLRGRVMDAGSGEPVSFASIGVGDLRKGTSSNINGEYLIRVDSLPVRLVFTHISFKRKEVIIDHADYLEVELTPGEILMDELVIEDQEKGEFAYTLLLRALSKAYSQSRDWKYGLAFYRQTSRNADDFSELYEIFFDTRYSSRGIEDWAIQEGRYAMKTGHEVNHYVFNKNFTLLTRLITMYQPQTDQFVMPVHPDVRELYAVDVVELQKVQDRRVARISFTPFDDVIVPAMEGDIYIDIDTHEILKLRGFFRTDKLDIIGLNNPQGSWKDHVLDIEVAYQPSQDQLRLDYIRLHQRFDYYIDDIYQHPVETHSFLTYYDYYEPEKFKRLGGRLMRYDRRDRDMLDRIGYNKRFWEDNPIVLRTPVEEEIIASFEAQDAFGSIYLNDREQVQLEKDNLDQDPFIQQIKAGLKNSKLPSSGEKVYLHTDRPFYAEGETIWFNAYIVNLATHVPSNISGVLYVDLISPEGDVLVNKRLEVIDAFAQGDIELDESLSPGVYRLRAYTNWMKNYDQSFFFDRPLQVYRADENTDKGRKKPEEVSGFEVQFMPEGGHLVHGITSQVAFRAIDQNGRGVDIRGYIQNGAGDKVAELKPRHKGMGNFFFVPKINETYQAVVNYDGVEKTFPLPEIRMSGYVLSVNNLKNRVVQVMVKASPDLEDSVFYLVGQTRGILYHREKAEIKKGSAVLNIPKSKLPNGIFHLTLFNRNHVPQCERLVFIYAGKPVFVNMETDNRVIRDRDPVKIDFELTDQINRTIRNTRISVAVTDADHVFKAPTAENIMTNLLLTSDLKGYIEDPGFYFMDDDRDTQIALDLVMLTHGWRRFPWQEIFDGSFVDTPYSHEFGINISGTAYLKGSRRPLKYSYINFMSVNDEFPGFWSTLTDVEGAFEMRNIDIPDTLSVVTITMDDKGRPRGIDVRIDPMQQWPAEKKAIQDFPLTYDREVRRYIERHEERKQIREAYDYDDKIVLKEIEITGDPYQDNIYGEPDDVIEITDELRFFSDIFQIIQGRVPGVVVSGQGLNASVRIRGYSSISLNNDPLFVVDGMPIGSTSAPEFSGSDSTSSGSNLANSGVNSVLMSLSPQNIDRIEILKGAASASAYGMRGANGVILIYTRTGNDIESEPEPSEGLRLPGYSLVREFYAPAYDVPSEEHVMPDKRTTIYWNPHLRTDNLGRASIEFFNSDDARTLQIDVQGVSDFGEMINETFLIGQDAGN